LSRIDTCDKKEMLSLTFVLVFFARDHSVKAIIKLDDIQTTFSFFLLLLVLALIMKEKIRRFANRE
ncbi:MAG: hypothetical protein ACRCWB_02555, partial [Enterovibrio sp.]